ncbi:hypothetical protein MNBD_NITROSPINAE01-179 [hydrothermal vent metagenome]|uniref:Uncharacterized protein n=1 Tax=hydrothermal vent metagenome TaxID=652676 RepID=A0A3B1C6Q8_9ZZZZ
MRKFSSRILTVLFVPFFMVMFSPINSFATPSTQIWIPSTDTQPFKTIHLGVDNYTTVMKDKKDGGHDLPLTMGATVGVLDTPDIGIEVGIDLREPTDNPVYYNAKVQIKEDSLYSFFPAIAIGGYDFGTESNATDFNITYVLAAKTLPVLGRVSLGYYVGNKDLLVDKNGAEANDGMLASYDRTLAEIDDRLWIAVDYMSGDNAYGALSIGFAWRFSPNISALLGYTSFNDEEVAGDSVMTIQFDMDF